MPQGPNYAAINMIRQFTHWRQAAAAFVILTMLSPVFASLPNTEPNRPKLTDEQKILHVLNRLGFGARPGDVEKVKALGLQNYIERQLNPDTIPDAAADAKTKRLEVFGMSTAEIFAKYPNPGAIRRRLAAGQQAASANEANSNSAQADQREKLNEIYRENGFRRPAAIGPQVTANRVLRAVYSERQLQEVMVDFWQNHFNVFIGKGAVRWYIPSYERDVLRKHALGNFRDLVAATAQHPAMLFYLDNFQSSAPGANDAGGKAAVDRIKRRLQNPRLSPEIRANLEKRLAMRTRAMQRQAGGLNENYARELMELHTLGVDGGYSQKDILEVAKAFSGWTIADPRGYRRIAAEIINAGGETPNRSRPSLRDGTESGEFFFNANRHQKGPKYLLGQTVNEGGIKDGLKVIDILANHPSAAKFIAKKLAVKFVSDNPSEAYVGRIAAAFQRSKGDIRTTLRAIFSDKEFFSPENYRAKVKTPFELAISSIRAIGADTNVSPAFIAMLNKLGEVPYGYQAPTGYPETAENWVNTGALLQRMNFAVAIASNRVPGTRVDLKDLRGGSRSKTLDNAVAEILNGEISTSTLDLLKKQIGQPLPDVNAGDDSDEDEMPTAGNRRARTLARTGDPEVFTAVSLVLGSPEFQRQ